MKIAILLHLLGVTVWIGGMFFAYLCLRPAAGALELPLRLPLWAATLQRFFRWVWLSVALILGSGFYMLNGIAQLARVPLYVYLMLHAGVLMMLIFAYVFFLPFPALKKAVAAQDWKAGAAALNQIRIAVAVNLALGLLNIVIATAGAL
ncbi:MAG: CopD family protein [Betaproteobacteria bacterium]|nr:CopD family protein [Betaproteobacteria bacterium]